MAFDLGRLILTAGLGTALLSCARMERPAGPEAVNWDFEAGVLDPWTVVSGDLDPQPVRATRPGVRFDQQGDFFIGTAELAPREAPMRKLGTDLDERRVGVLRSPSFAVDRPSLTFLISGGYSPADLQLLLVRDSDGETLRAATGWDNEVMARRIWDVRHLRGETCHLEIIDRTRRSRWGHLNVDDIRLVNEAELRALMPPVMAGEFRPVYDPSVGEMRPWYINDHCVIRGPDGLWHLFGITHAEPADPMDEDHLAHATSRSLWQAPWRKHPFALDVDETCGEVHLWAPHVVEHAGLFHMFYCAGDEDHTRYKIHQATSRDLWHWQRVPENPMVVDGYDARDPFVTRVGDQWVLYYTATDPPAEGHHIVACVTSDDLVHWGDRRVVFTHEARGRWGGPTESPQVVRRGEHWYLFVGPSRGYDGTDVYRSDNPFHWDMEDRVGFIPAHAPEVVRDLDGGWAITRCGWGRGGVQVAPLLWNDGQDGAATNFPVPR